jgi:hypothetical protein
MLVMAQAASFWHLKSPLPSTSINGRTTLLVMKLQDDKETELKELQVRDGSGVNNFLNSFVRAIGEVRKSPASVGEDLFVVVVDQVGQGGKKLPDGRTLGGGLLLRHKLDKVQVTLRKNVA